MDLIIYCLIFLTGGQSNFDKSTETRSSSSSVKFSFGAIEAEFASALPGACSEPPSESINSLNMFVFLLLSIVLASDRFSRVRPALLSTFSFSFTNGHIESSAVPLAHKY